MRLRGLDMAPPGSNKEGSQGRLRDILDRGRRLLSWDETETAQPAVERRVSNRILLPLPVRVRVGQGDFRDAQTRDVNLPGLSVAPAEDARPGEPVAIAFGGFPGVAPAFTLVGNVMRIVTEEPPAMGIKVDRKSTAPEALRHYRSLVLHYVHHRPLLDDVSSGYFEGRCASCGWVGRVGRRAPRCSHCGGRVQPI